MRRVLACVHVVVAAGLLAIGLPATALAQGDRASISGLVTDTSGAVLPGVTVEASSPALIEQSRTVTTDGEGRYNIVDLRPGTYSVLFSLPGFRTFRREGIILEGAFTATINANLAVGAVAETVTVSGSSPVVDIQNTRTQLVVNQTILQALPVMRSIQDQANLVPGVVSRSTSAGQILSDFYINSMVARGASDQHIVYDGVRNDMLLGAGTQAIAGGVNELAQAEMVYDVSGQSAEFATAGVRMDAIPKDGGNSFNGTWRLFGSHNVFQSDNLSQELRDQNITAVNQLDFNWDNNVAVGGPIKQNKLWFFTAFDLSQFNILVANVYFPDGRQADTGGHVKPNGSARLTWQASPKDKVAFTYYNSTSLTDRYDFTSTTTPEAGLRVNSPLNFSGVLKWSRPATSRLLLEAGEGVSASTYHWEYQPEVGIFEVAHRSPAGITSVASSIAPVENFNHSFNTVASASYVTGSHALKGGMTLTTGYSRTKVEPHGDIVLLNYITANSGTVTVRNSPVTSFEELHADLGLYLQDKWTVNRLTMTFGGRMDYLNAGTPPQTAPAGRFVPARSAGAIDCVPCWTDWSVRFGGSYDLFGTGKTALKFSVGKFMVSQLLNVAQAVNPIRSASDTRTWVDLDGNGSALDAAGNAQYNEIGASPSTTFGTTGSSTRFDPETPRPTNWEENVSVVHELLPRVAVTAGYYHRNFQHIANTINASITGEGNCPVVAATPAAQTVGPCYVPYSVIAPLDPRLPNGGGELIPRFNQVRNIGLTDNVLTQSELNTRVYDGFEVSVNARLPRQGFVFGGVTTERTNVNNCDPTNINPDTLRFCDQHAPFRTLVKGSAGVTIPWQIQLSGSMSAIPGSDIQANFTYNGAFAGVTLAAPNSRTINLVEPNTMFLDYQTQVDGRVARSFRIGRARRLQTYMDFFNLLNASTVVSVNTTYALTNNQWLKPLVVMQGRRLQFGARFDF
jgi:hypothetical protein